MSIEENAPLPPHAGAAQAYLVRTDQELLQEANDNYWPHRRGTEWSVHDLGPHECLRRLREQMVNFQRDRRYSSYCPHPSTSGLYREISYVEEIVRSLRTVDEVNRDREALLARAEREREARLVREAEVTRVREARLAREAEEARVLEEHRQARDAVYARMWESYRLRQQHRRDRAAGVVVQEDVADVAEDALGGLFDVE